MPLGANIRTIGERLHDQGVPAAYIGKWHLDGTDYLGSGRCPAGWDPRYWFDMRCCLEQMPDRDRTLSRQAGTAEAVHRHRLTGAFTFAHQCSDRRLASEVRAERSPKKKTRQMGGSGGGPRQP